jgi:hypothetical protein
MNVDPLALYGAVVATGVALWDAYKWWRSEHVRLSGFTSSNMKTFGGGVDLETERNTYTMLRVQNRGSVPCVVQLVVLRQYANFFDQYVRRKIAAEAFINHSGTFGPTLPHRLEKGDEFSSGVLQNEEFEKMSREGRLYLGISHTMAGKPFYVRVKPIKPKET